MKVAITGGTGFVGKQLAENLVEKGHEVYILTRSPEKKMNTKQVKYIGWLTENADPISELPALDGVVNLAGESLFGKWTSEKKEAILKSRMEATNALTDLIGKMEHKPEVLVSGSAVGYYGTSEANAFTEETDSRGEDFLGEVAYKWEQCAKQAEAYGVRTVLARLGIVLGDKGALPMMSIPFKLFGGGKIGNGEQWMSWVHVKDAAGMIVFALENKSIKGPFNVTAPAPRRNKDFSRALAGALHRPYWTAAPSFVIEKSLGEMSLLILEGQCVYPKKAEEHGYSFQYPKLHQALIDIV